MTRRILPWCAIAALALIVLPLLARNAAMIPAHVPLDPNEGWNAAHALAAMVGRALYPPPGALMVNNYPPLSFYVVGALGRVTGDMIVAGRILSLLAFLAVCAGIAAVSRNWGVSPRGALFATLFFAAVLLVGSDYVGMDDPQLLGHAVQLAALLAMLRGRIVLAAALFAASLFVKHNLLAMPLAAVIWLAARDRRAGVCFAAAGLGLGLAGFIAFRFAYGVWLWTELASPRLSSLANLQGAVARLWWAPLPLIAFFGRRHAWFGPLYAAMGLALGLFFSTGDGVDANAFFDLAIALSLMLGQAVEARPVLAALSAAPPLMVLALTFSDNNYFFTRDFAAQSARDIAFLQSRPGPALCDQLSLCLWAGKRADVDVFNAGEAIRSGARDPAPLTQLLEKGHFSVLQLEDRDALGPQARAAIARRYRLHHADDNGFFLTPAP